MTGKAYRYMHNANTLGHAEAYRLDPPVVPAIASAAAGGIRCPLDDMLAWARQWLAPTPAQLAWLGPEQRELMWSAVTPMPLSQRRKDWNDTHVYAYALGFRLADAFPPETPHHRRARDTEVDHLSDQGEDGDQRKQDEVHQSRVKPGEGEHRDEDEADRARRELFGG